MLALGCKVGDSREGASGALWNEVVRSGANGSKSDCSAMASASFEGRTGANGNRFECWAMAAASFEVRTR